MQGVQIFGIRNSQATRAAERFFKERRVPIHFVDLKQKSMAPGEMKRFIEKFGWPALLDSEGKAYEDAGLNYLQVSDVDLLKRVEQEPRLLRLPFVRSGKAVCIGHDEESWRAMANAS
jgi:arsenate reductase-like glutaredoxin family protein